MVDIFPQFAPRASHRAGGADAEPETAVIWMQLGVRNDEAAALAEANGVKVVMNRCPKIEYGRLSSEICVDGREHPHHLVKEGDARRRDSAAIARQEVRARRRDRRQRTRATPGQWRLTNRAGRRRRFKRKLPIKHATCISRVRNFFTSLCFSEAANNGRFCPNVAKINSG